MKAKEIRKFEGKERINMLEELRKEFMKLKSQIKSGLVPDNSSRIRQVRKDIARLLTLKREKGEQ